MAGYRAQKGSNDFDTFYNAGRAVISGEGIYYAKSHQGQLEEAGPFLYPPFAACFFALFAVFPLSAAAFFWNFFILVLFVASLSYSAALLRINACDLKDFWLQSSPFDKLATLFIPVLILIDNISMSQINILILFLCLVVLLTWRRKRPFLAGIILSTAIWIKLTPALFCFYFLAKRSWKVLLGVLIGSLLTVLLIPTLLFGLEENRILQRQWVGRALKPRLISVISHYKKYEPHPERKSPETYQNIQLATTLVSSNQSLESSLTRWLLKNRNDYAYSKAFPIYSAQRYDKLPVLFGGIPLKSLKVLLFSLQLGFLIFLIAYWSRCREAPKAFILEVSLAFLSMSLLSPLARSHQFISFLFPLVAFLFLFVRERSEAVLLWGVRLSCIFYLLQALPYGKAAGMGTWANLCLWIAFAISLIQLNRKYETKTCA